MGHRGIRITLHLFGRAMFTLSFEWIERNLWGGFELATLPSHGKSILDRH